MAAEHSVLKEYLTKLNEDGPPFIMPVHVLQNECMNGIRKFYTLRVVTNENLFRVNLRNEENSEHILDTITNMDLKISLFEYIVNAEDAEFLRINFGAKVIHIARILKQERAYYIDKDV